MDERPPDLFDFGPDEREFGRQQTANLKPLLHAASSLVILDLSPRSCNEDNANPGPAVRLPNAQLRVSVRWILLLALVVSVVGVLGAGIILCYGDGIRLGSFVSSDKTDAEKKAMLDKFNAVSGSLVAAVLIPIERFIAMSVSVACLCFATDWMLQRGVDDMQSKAATGIVVSVITYMLSNGLSSLNVQLASGDYHVRIVAQDLAINSTVDYQAVAENGSLITTWNASFAESSDGNSALNTILRTKLIATEDVRPTCNGSSDSQLRPPMLSFGFASRSWQLETLQSALSPDKPLELNLDNASMSSLPNDNKLPMAVDIATYLAAAATQVVRELLPMFWEINPFGIYTIYDGNGDEALSMADLLNISATDFIGTSTPVLHGMLARSSNVSIDGARLGYKHIPISESVAVDALTLEIPTKPTSANSKDNICTPEGCLAQQSFGESSHDIQPIVYAAAVCINDDGSEDLRVVTDQYLSDEDVKTKTCPQLSKTSMLLVGLGKQIVGGTWDYVTDEHGNRFVQVQDMSLTYTVTVARLSWQIENLTEVFAAECVNDGGCDGVRTPLNPSPDSDVLVIGESALPLKQLDYFSMPSYVGGFSSHLLWKQLVLLAPSMDFLDDDLLLPRRFANITKEGGAIRDISYCLTSYDIYIKNVEKNHLYAEESLQMTYTAAFFFLFQDAARLSRVSSTPSSLAFAGNTQQLNIQASIPTINIYVSICGCVVLLAMSIGVAIVQKRSTKRIEERADDEVVAEALLNSDKYPPMLLKMALEDLSASCSDKQRISLEDLRIQLAEFAKKQAPTDQKTSEFTLMSSLA